MRLKLSVVLRCVLTDLARAVRPDDADHVVTADSEVDIAQYGAALPLALLIVEPVPAALHLHNGALRQLRPLRQQQSASLTALVQSALPPLLLQLVVVVDARLTLRLLSPRIASHPLQLSRYQLLQRLALLCLSPEPLLALLQPAAVVALVRIQLARIDLQYVAGHVVEKVAVVRDGDDEPGVGGEERLEPRDAAGVQVVGGLVQQ